MSYILVSMATCNPCKEVKQRFSESIFPYFDLDIKSEDPEHKELISTIKTVMRAKGLKTVPQLFHIDDVTGTLLHVADGREEIFPLLDKYNQEAS